MSLENHHTPYGGFDKRKEKHVMLAPFPGAFDRYGLPDFVASPWFVAEIYHVILWVCDRVSLEKVINEGQFTSFSFVWLAGLQSGGPRSWEGWAAGDLSTDYTRPAFLCQ